MMASRLLGSAHLLHLTHLRGFTQLLGSRHIFGSTHLWNSPLQYSTRLFSSVHSSESNPKNDESSPKNDKSSPKCDKSSPWWLNIFASVTTVFTSIFGFWIFTPYISIWNIRRKILKSQCPFQVSSEEVVIERKVLQEDLEKFLDLDGYQPNPLTHVVCGPHGSGKTAAVINLLKGRKGVVYVHIRDGDDTYLAQEILCALSVTVPQGTDPTCLLGRALQGIQKLSRTPRKWFDGTPQDPGNSQPDEMTYSILQDPDVSQPILVVDFNPGVDYKSFENILFLLKSWGSDSGWVKPIVILTGTLGLQRPRLELRTEFFKIDDLSEEECESYREKLCKMKNINTDQLKLTPKRWNRLLHLSILAQRKVSSLDDLKKEATRLEEEISDSYEKALISFKKEIEKKTYSKQHRVVCKLMEGKEVYLKDFCDDYSLPEKDIIDILLDIRPRPFYIHPQTRQVYIGSKFMMPERYIILKKILFFIDKELRYL